MKHRPQFVIAAVGSAVLIVAVVTVLSLPTLRRMAGARERPLAQLGAQRIAEEHVLRLLTRHAIHWWGASSAGTGYVIECCLRDRDRALSILKDDAVAFGYSIELCDGWCTPEDCISPVIHRQVDKPLRELLAMPEYAEGTTLGSLLRHDYVQKHAAVCPIVRTIATRAQRYLDHAGTPQVGYWVELDLVRDLTSESPRSLTRYWVWDNGQQVRSISAFGT